MWLLIARAPRRDAVYWTGRRWLALLDAVAWPTLWAVAVMQVPVSTGLVVTVVVSLLVVVAARRSHRAILKNERYWFTTVRWGLVLAGLAAVGAGTKLLA